MQQETQLTPRKSTWRWPSIQQYGWVQDRDAQWLANTYFSWVDVAVPLTRAAYDGENVAMRLGPIRRPAIELQRRSASDDKVEFEVVGGWLANGPDAGTFEFERTERGARVALRDYSPALPRAVYFLTQAMVHAVVMWMFGRFLRRITRGTA